MVGLQRDINGNRYILTVINVFLKYAWSVIVKNNDGKSIRDALKISSDIRKSAKTGSASNGQRKTVC